MSPPLRAAGAPAVRAGAPRRTWGPGRSRHRPRRCQSAAGAAAHQCQFRFRCGLTVTAGHGQCRRRAGQGEELRRSAHPMRRSGAVRPGRQREPPVDHGRGNQLPRRPGRGQPAGRGRLVHRCEEHAQTAAAGRCRSGVDEGQFAPNFMPGGHGGLGQQDRRVGRDARGEEGGRQPGRAGGQSQQAAGQRATQRGRQNFRHGRQSAARSEAHQNPGADAHRGAGLRHPQHVVEALRPPDVRVEQAHADQQGSEAAEVAGPAQARAPG